MANKEIYIKYKSDEVQRILQSRTFWKSVEYFHNLFGLAYSEYDSLVENEARKFLVQKCAFSNCNVRRPGDKYGSHTIPNNTKKLKKLLNEKMAWCDYVIAMATDFIFTLCDITEKSIDEKTAKKLASEQLPWELCWEEMVARCIIHPRLKKYFYHKKLNNELIKQLFTVRVKDENLVNKEKRNVKR